MRKQLSTSVYTFRTIIEENLMYVDKTREIYKLVEKINGQYFMSRPRRFGKSLTLSTLEAIFNGEKELFKGLYIYDKPYDWEKFPIIKIALNKMGSQSVEELEENLSLELDYVAEDNDLVLTGKRSSQKFREIIRKLYNKQGKVVILIDEYDKPILDNIIDNGEVIKIKQLLKSFYGIIKASEEYLRFTFITGVSKFTQVSVFSDLNNLDDITMVDDFATLCGFTQEECEFYFEEWIDENSEKLNISREQYLETLRVTYNGIRFSEREVTVYNPVSFTKAMEYAKIKHYWFETGTPSFLLKLLKSKEYDIINFENLQIKSNMFSSYDVENLRVEPLLYQTGYLTIKDYDEENKLFTLSYPNAEVKEAFIEYLFEYFTTVPKEQEYLLIVNLKKAFMRNDLDEVFEILDVFYAQIDNSIKIKQEKYYQTIFYILFTLMGFRISVEVNTNKGRMDAVVFTEDRIYIIEFKLDKSAKIAIDQIRKREYYQKFQKDGRELVLIGVSFTSETGGINDRLVEVV